MGSSTKVNGLFEPIKIGALEIKNRIVMSAMAVGDATSLARIIHEDCEKAPKSGY